MSSNKPAVCHAVASELIKGGQFVTTCLQAESACTPSCLLHIITIPMCNMFHLTLPGFVGKLAFI